MKLRATVRMPEVRLTFDTSGAEQLAADLWESSRANFLGGRQPGGGPLPLNQQGLPLGVGGGSLVRSWRVSVGSRRKGQTSASMVPTDRGRLLAAIRAMVKRGVRFQGLDGTSGERWRALARKHAKDIMVEALRRASKR